MSNRLSSSASVVGIGPQELGELPLRQHHHLAELRQVKAEQPPQEMSGLVEPVGQRGPRFALPLLEVDARLLDDGAGATPLRPLPLRRAGQPQPPAAHGRLEHDLGPTPGAAWSLRRLRLPARAPGTWP